MANIARLVLAAFIVTLPGVSDALAAAAVNARVSVVKAGVNGLPVPSRFSAGHGLLPLLNVAPDLIQPALKPGADMIVPNARLSLELASQQAVVAGLSDLSVDQAKVQASLAFDNAGMSRAQTGDGVETGSFAIGGGQTLEKPAAGLKAKTPAVPPSTSKKSKEPQAKGWSLKTKLAAGALTAAGLAGAAYVLNMIGLPETAAALTMLPVLGMAGTLGNGAPGRGLPDHTILQYYQLLGKGVKVGGVITEAAQSQTAQALGLSEAAKDAAMLKLTEQNRIAAFTNGVFIYTDLHRRAAVKNDDPALAQADQLGFMGLKLVNSADFYDKVKGVFHLGEAQRDYAASANANRQLGIVKNNAQMEILRDLLRAHDKVLSGERQTPQVQQRRQQLAAAIEWARETVFAAGVRTPEMISAHDRDFLLGIIRSLPESNYGEREDYDEIAGGLMQLENFIEGFGPEPVSSGEDLPPKKNTVKQLTGPTSNPNGDGKGFPLLRKGDDRVKALSAYGSNLTARAVDGELTPLIGRKEEIRQAVKTLLMVDENNPVFIGESGVGKTALAEGLAQAIVNGEIPQLAGVNIYQLDLTKVVAGTKYRGEFEERMQNIMDEVKASNGKIILFIDELHRVIGAGESGGGGNDASNILKESLTGGKMSVIGATTLSEYKKIEKDAALKRRFNPIMLQQPSKEEAFKIVMGVKFKYEKKHNVTISEEVVKAAVDSAARYITDRQMPASVLKLIDMAASEVELQTGRADRAVTVQDIAFEISVRTGIPVGQLGADDLALLQSLPDELKKRLIGQDHAIEKVVRAIRRGRLGYRDPKKPVGTFALLGPTGVGKTHLVRVIAKFLFRSEKSMVRIDMSEYKEKFSISRLIGAPPGYVGYEGDGELTEKVRRNPHSAVLFDEVDKAHPEVLDLLLQILDDGFITDSQGRKIDFSHTLIFLTANTGGSLGAAAAGGEKRRRIGFITEEDERKEKAPTGEELDARSQGYIDAFKAATRPEFFNRVGKANVLVFNDLDRGHLAQILDIGIGELNDRIKHKEMTISLTDAAKARLLDEAASEENRAYGARPLGQALENDVESALVDAELAKQIANGDAVLVDVVDGKFVAKKKAP